MKYYLLGDWLPNIPQDEQQHYRAKFIVGSGTSGYGVEFRCPKKGEWYLSGSTPVAFLAPNDLSIKYHIMKIVKIRTVVTIEEVG